MNLMVKADSKKKSFDFAGEFREIQESTITAQKDLVKKLVKKLVKAMEKAKKKLNQLYLKEILKMD